MINQATEEYTAIMREHTDEVLSKVIDLRGRSPITSPQCLSVFAPKTKWEMEYCWFRIFYAYLR